jgi:outer membrane protein OmpA-like peptidoglycan-associated protein
MIIPLIAEYEYRGQEIYRDIPVHRIHAQYASRYPGASSARSVRPRPVPQSPEQADTDFKTLQGTHVVDILLRVSDGLPLLIRDNLDETFTWPDGSTLRFRGFTLTFGEGIVPLDRGATIAALRESLQTEIGGAGTAGAGGSTAGGGSGTGGAGANGSGTGADGTGGGGTGGTSIAQAGGNTAGGGAGRIPADGNGTGNGGNGRTTNPPPVIPALEQERSMDISSVPEGIRLTVRDLRFAPDSADLLPAERGRLDTIAQALRDFPGRNFLVEGHTAAVGRPQGEMQLSIERAQRIVAELVRRGIAADRFVYKGSGGTKPMGDNANEAGRRLNRRVEITILE